MLKVQIYVEEKLVKVHEFNNGERELYIGRHFGHPIRLDDIGVSADHARLTLTSAVVVEDLKSTNGTLLNGEPLSRPTPLNPGDTLQIARFQLRIKDERDLTYGEIDTFVVEPKTIPLHPGNSTLERTGFFSYTEYRKSLESGAG